MKTAREILLFVFLILPGIISFAQPAIEWQKSIGGTGGDFGNSACMLRDSGAYYIAGYSNSNDLNMIGNHGGMDIFLSKIDLSGNLLWTKLYGGIANEYTQCIIPTHDNGILICGFTNDSVTAGTHGGFDVMFIKTDSAGNQQWIKFYGGSGDDGDHAAGIVETTDKSFVCITGARSNDGDVGANYGSSDFWLFKTDSLGNFKWGKNYGGTDDEDGHAIVPMPDGGFILAGHTASDDMDVSGQHNPNSGIHDGWVIRVDSARNIIWQKCIGGTGFELINRMYFNKAGKIVLVGYTDSNDGDISGNHGQSDVWIAKMDTAAGNLLFSKVYGGSGFEGGSNMIVNDDGSYTVSATSNSTNGDVTGNHGSLDYWVLKIDSTGNIIWENSYGGTDADYGGKLMPTPDKGIIISGFANSSNGDVAGNYGYSDNWVIKLHCTKPSPGFLLSATMLCPKDSAFFTNTSLGAVSYAWYINGTYFANTANISTAFPTPGNYTIMLIASLDDCADTLTQLLTVNPIPVVSLGNDTAISQGTSITLNAGNPGATYLWSTGATTQTITINTPDTFYVDVNVNGCITSDTIVVSVITDIPALYNNSGLQIFPLPCTDFLHLSFSSPETSGNIILYSLDGRQILYQEIHENHEIIDVSRVERGIYFLKICTAGNYGMFKIVKN